MHVVSQSYKQLVGLIPYLWIVMNSAQSSGTTMTFGPGTFLDQIISYLFEYFEKFDVVVISCCLLTAKYNGPCIF